jgi:8-oxo-dGTP pyrophosphatase MutT (NUDIX family)
MPQESEKPREHRVIARPAPDATTIILVRPAQDGGAPELFMVERSGGADFFGSAYVFPGGGVDPADSDPELISRGAPLESIDLERLLGEGLSRDQAVGCWIAGIRELFEEAGVMLAYRGSAMLSFGDPTVRARFENYREELREIVEREELTLATDRVRYFSRFVTPPYARKRYDTRFVVAEAPPDQLASHDREEVVSGAWITAPAAVALFHSRAQQIVPPTLQNLLELEPCRSAGEMVSLAEGRAIAPICPATVRLDGAFTLIYPGDRDFMHQLEPAFTSIYKRPAPLPALRFKLEEGGRWAIAPGFTAGKGDHRQMAKSLEQRIQELEDRDQIKELTARYCWHVARGEGKQVAELFTDDGALEVNDGSFKPVRGRAALDKFYASSVNQPELAIPFIQNHIIEVSDDQAHGTCAIEARFARNGQSVTAAGYYEDRYRREAGKWRFVERKITFWHVVPLKQGWAEAKAAKS